MSMFCFVLISLIKIKLMISDLEVMFSVGIFAV
jgi:hypothetical protein